MSYWLHEQAETELGNIAIYYAEHASKLIAEAFIDESERVIGLIQINQQIGSLRDGGLRVFPFRRFPYSVVYRENASGPQIYAVAHQSREPGFWQDRL